MRLAARDSCLMNELKQGRQRRSRRRSSEVLQRSQSQELLVLHAARRGLGAEAARVPAPRLFLRRAGLIVRLDKLF